jgi:ketosteroid isomerase-like protein
VSETNVDIMRRAYAALAEDGLEAALQFTDPEFAATTPASLASEPGTYRGHEGIRRYFGSFGDAMDEVHFEGREFTAYGDNVVVDTLLRARGRTTGIETEQHAFVVWTLRDGRITRSETFAEEDEAVAAAEGRR